MRVFRTASAIALVAVLGFGTAAIAQGNGHGNGHGKGHQKHEKDYDDDRREDRREDHAYRDYYYGDREHREIRYWYERHQNSLPPGLAKKDRLPPGLERQLVRRGTLPPGLMKKVRPCPRELVVLLPPPPPESSHVIIDGHIVLLNNRTNVVLDVFSVF